MDHWSILPERGSAELERRLVVQVEERDGDRFDDRRCPEAQFVASFVHEYGEKERVGVAVEVGVLDGVCLEDGGAEKANREQKHMG